MPDKKQDKDMKKSVKMALRSSELRSEINELKPDETSNEKRGQLMAELSTAEKEYRTALMEESKAEKRSETTDLDAEEKEICKIESRAELTNVFSAVMSDSQLNGAEAELQAARGLSGDRLPIDFIAPKVEHRADAITAAPSDVQINQRNIIGRVFARSSTAALGVAMPMVPVGAASFPVLSAGASGAVVAANASVGDAAAATLEAHTIKPKRIQIEYVYSIEDSALMPGLDNALRMDLSKALSDKLDYEVLQGGAAGLGGLLSAAADGGLPARADTPAALTYAIGAGELAKQGIDGKYAGSEAELCAILGVDTLVKMASLFQANTVENLSAYYQRVTRKTMASANVPGITSTNQEGILAKLGGGGMNAVAPVWSSISLIRDNVSRDLRKKGQVSITLIMLAGFQILRDDGFSRLKFKVG